MEPSVPANKIHDVSKGMFITLLKGGLSGLVLGYLLALLLGRSVWLEMRVNIGLAIPVCTLACILFSFWKRTTIRYAIFLFLELSLVVTFLFLYRFELDAFLVIPACLFREGCHLNFAGLGFINILLAVILFAGNFLWIFRGPHNLKG
jgi:hypothetical protein